VIFEKVKKFYLDYSGKKCIIGYSFRGLEIYAFHIGSQLGRQFISTYAIHGREWITAELALKHIKIGVKRGGGWIIPLVNPDGAKICETSNPLWKANARGVDLNCNFDASWGSGMFNTRVRGAENCIGEYPFSETESNALKNFTLKVRPEVTFSFHTKGGEIYWEFLGRGERYGATLLQKATGYPIKTLRGSAGGYKDWCIDKLHIPAYTIECGSENLTHPIKNIKKLKKCYKALKYFTENYGK
jgi:hypothetical protein